MSDEAKPEFDPRFSPAFQRGFDPAATDVAEAAPLRPRLSEPPAAAVRIQPAHSAVAPPAPTVARPIQPAPQARTVQVPAEQTAVPVLLEGPLDDASAPAVEPTVLERQGRNPFLIVLGVLAIALVALGSWLFLRAGAAFNSREVRSQGDYMSLQATIYASPFVVMLGVLTALGVLFIVASRWWKRR